MKVEVKLSHLIKKHLQGYFCENESPDLATVWKSFENAIFTGRGLRELSKHTAEIMENHSGWKVEVFESVHKIARKVNIGNIGNILYLLT